MRIQTLTAVGALAAALLLAAAPADARHKHRRDCGHVYRNGGWVAFDFYGNRGGFSYRSAPSPYHYASPCGYRGGYDDRCYRPFRRGPYHFYPDHYRFKGKRRGYCDRRCHHRHRHVVNPFHRHGRW